MIPAQGSTTRLRTNRKDRIFKAITLVMALLAMSLPILIAAELARRSGPSIHKFGWTFLISRVWDPVHAIYGALPFIFGTVVSSFLALILAVPLGLGAALWLVETAPRFLRKPVSFLLELLAAIPSVVYGLWGIFVLVPLLRDKFEQPLAQRFPDLPLLSGQPLGIGMLSAGLILVIMVVPFIISASQQVLEAVPDSQREAALSLGATKYEMMRTAVLPYARSGVVGAIMLGLGRALGETMAITMVIGNVPSLSLHLFSPAYSMASLLANDFTEADNRLILSALIEIALLLFVISILVNLLARFLINKTATRLAGAPRT